MTTKLRTCTPDDLAALAAVIGGAFLDGVSDDELAEHRLIFEPERNYLATDAEQPVAAGGVLSRELTVPGAVVPAAHVTGVAVRATHRRRGLLTQLMTQLLDDVARAGTEPIAVLWATEGAIYGRYGYGLASWNVSYRIATNEIVLPAPATGAAGEAGMLRAAVPAEIRDQLAPVHERVGATRPGVSSRPGRWWEMRTSDSASLRRGWSAEQAVLYDVGDRLDGYAMWRTKSAWGDHGPHGEVAVTEVIASTLDAYIALWRFLLSIDLVRTVHCRHAAVDEPLAHLVSKPEALGASMRPGLWVRVVDVPNALSARRYQSPIDVVLEVTDERMPSNQGRWHLRGDGSQATCVPTGADADLGLDVRELGAAYLGGMTLAELGAAGLVSEYRAGSLAAASNAFGWIRAPWSHEVF